jgi:hypothetical protein
VCPDGGRGGAFDEVVVFLEDLLADVDGVVLTLRRAAPIVNIDVDFLD